MDARRLCIDRGPRPLADVGAICLHVGSPASRPIAPPSAPPVQVLAAVLFYSALFLTAVVVPSFLVGGLLLVVEHERAWWSRVQPIAASVLGCVGAPRLLHAVARRSPRLAAFVARRLDRRTPWGLSATVTLLVAALGLWLFLGVPQDLVAREPLATLDLRLHNTVPLFRTADMTWVMLAFTELGSPVVLWLVALSSAAFAVAARKPRVALTFVVAVAVTSVLSSALRELFGYARPPGALILADTESFPSEHQLVATVVYGLLASLLLSSPLRRSVRVLGATGLVLLVVGVGLSRLYLGVNWPSDILGSLALALVCLATLLFLLHYPGPLPRLERRFVSAPWRQAQRLGVALLLGAGLAAVVLLPTTLTLTPAPPAPARHVELAALQRAWPPDLPRRSEDLLGDLTEPPSLILVGSQEELTAAFRAAGWTLADAPSPARVAEEALAALRGAPDPSGPATPEYLADRPQALTFERPQHAGASIQTRHHTRLWPTSLCVAPSCRALWVATASFDTGIEFSPEHHLPTHSIDPDVDAERRLIVADLLRAGATAAGEIPVTPPLVGTNAGGDSFRTDGRAALVVLPVASV